MNFPPPDAPRKAVDAFYAEQGMEQPKAEPYQPAPKDKTQWIPFDGNEYCSDECRGWDGKSYRCDCGNRRVYWDEIEGHKFARAD